MFKVGIGYINRMACSKLELDILMDGVVKKVTAVLGGQIMLHLDKFSFMLVWN